MECLSPLWQLLFILYASMKVTFLFPCFVFSIFSRNFISSRTMLLCYLMWFVHSHNHLWSNWALSLLHTVQAMIELDKLWHVGDEPFQYSLLIPILAHHMWIGFLKAILGVNSSGSCKGVIVNKNFTAFIPICMVWVKCAASCCVFHEEKGNVFQSVLSKVLLAVRSCPKNLHCTLPLWIITVVHVHTFFSTSHIAHRAQRSSRVILR